MPYNIRGVVGNRKGKFIKQKEKDKIARLLTAKTEKRPSCSECSEIKVGNDLLQGRVIVEKDTLAKNMWCSACDKLLSLRNLQQEKFQGIVSKWFIKCQFCGITVQVETGMKSNPKYYDTNLKSVVGMLDAGVGETKINAYLSALNHRTHDAKSLKRNERFVGQKIESLGKSSCMAAIEKEKLSTLAYQRQK